MIHKDVYGQYGLTSFGTLVLFQLSGLDCAARHQKYFLEYDASRLPDEFTCRMEELAEGRFIDGTFKVLEVIERGFREAQEYIWVLSDQNLSLLTPILAEKMKTSVDLRFILPQGAFPPDSRAPLPSSMPNVHKRVLQKVDCTVAVTEKQAGFSLPRRRLLDYRSFIGEDPKFHKWCKDLLLHYWEKATPFVSE